MNTEQHKYIADVCKIVAVAQFGVIGYTGFMENNLTLFVGSGLLFTLLVYLGIIVLEGERHD